MKRAILAAVTAALMMVFAASALAEPVLAPGWLEICKSSDTSSPVTGIFNYTVNGSMRVAVETGTCTAPFRVPAGEATVVEDSHPYAAVTSITTTPGDRLISSSLGSGTATVSVPSGDISNTTTVSYTNKELTGYIEICKKGAPGTGLSGSFQFTITGAMGFSQSVGVPVGACSNSIQAPAGSVKVVENAAATYVTSITAQPAAALLSSNIATASSVLAVKAGDVSTESIVTYTDSPSVLKICKVAGSNNLGSVVVGTSFPFTANNQSLDVPAGAPPGGTCKIVPGIFTAGTTVNVAEGVVPGTDVQAVRIGPSDRAVPGSLNLSNRTVSVVLGSGETVVTYVNEPAPPGTLKICKHAGTGVATGSLWAFTVSGTSGTTMVPAGSCAIVGTFPFNSDQTVTETPTMGFSVSAIAANPASRLVSSNLGAGSASVNIGSGVTEAIFTNSASTTTTTTTSSTGSSTTSMTTTTSSSSLTTKTATSTAALSHQNSKPLVKSAARPARVQSWRVLTRHGRHYLVIRVSSSHRTARIRVTRLGRHGQVLGTRTVTVHTGRSLSITIGGSFRQIRVALVH